MNSANECAVLSREECAWPGWFDNFASQQCESREMWSWLELHMPDREPPWWAVDDNILEQT